jgi:hypothetical protein
MASQGGGAGISKSDILKLLYSAPGGAAPTTDGIGFQLDAALVNSGVN